MHAKTMLLLSFSSLVEVLCTEGRGIFSSPCLDMKDPVLIIAVLRTPSPMFKDL